MSNNLVKALSIFTSKFDLDYFQNIGSLNYSIQNGYINLDRLKEEFLEAVNNDNTNWNKFAVDSEIIENVQNYANIEIKNYIKYLLYDYLFPELMLTDYEIKEMTIDVEKILREREFEEVWMFSYDLFNILKGQEKYKNFEYYNLWKLPYFIQYIYNDGSRIVADRVYFNVSILLENNVKIERKIIDDKDLEIGFLRIDTNKKTH